MEFGRNFISKVLKKKKKKTIMASVILQGLEVHFYLPDKHQIIHLSGRFTAEELCVEAAKKLGEFVIGSKRKYCWTPKKIRLMNVVSLLQIYLLCVAVCLLSMMNITRSGFRPITPLILMRQQD